MPADFFKIELDDKQLLGALNKLIQRGGNLEPALRDIGEYMIKSTKDRFAAGEAPDGAKWPENKPSTLARKKGGKPLIGESKRLSSEIIYGLIDDGVEIGSALEYAAVQQFGAEQGAFGSSRHGGPIPWGDIPARPFLGISGEDEVAIREILADYLTGDLVRGIL